MPERTVLDEDIGGGMVDQSVPLLGAFRNDKPGTKGSTKGEVGMGVAFLEHRSPFGPCGLARFFLMGPGQMGLSTSSPV